MDALTVTFTLLIIVGIFVYLWFKQKYNYWLKRNIICAPETLFFYPRNQHAGLYFQQLYNRFKAKKEPFVGCLTGFIPSLLIIDLDLLKRVFISDFESFPDRGFYHNVRDDPLSLNLLRLQGDTWRRLRAKITPTFSSGKMKLMFPAKVAIGERLVKTIEDFIKNQKTEVEIRDLCARFATDIIGSTAFGIECNSLADPLTQFRLKGDKACQCYRPLLENLGALYPKFFQRLHVTAFSKELIDFYSNIVRDTLTIREEKNIRRNDFLDILIELQKTETENGEPTLTLTLDEIIGQVFVFFIAGYDTSSSAMTYCLYELSQNPEIQEIARADVLETMNRFNGVLSYDCMKEMHYLKKVVLETFRKYPIAPLLRRVVRNRYQIPNSTCILEEGCHVLIPVYGIHHDPEYYPKPEKFDPERFSSIEEHKRHLMTFLSFGAGPRTCIAERFATIEITIGVALLLKHFRLSPSPKTPKVIEFDVKELRILKVKNLFLNVERL